MQVLSTPFLPLVGLMLVLPAPRPLGEEPNTGTFQYPQYRQISGLAGGGYGLDEDGRPSLSGPTAFSTPVAYVLGHDRVQIALSSESFNSLPALGVGSSNGHALISYGHTFGACNVMVTDLVKSHSLDQAYNLQVAIIKRPRDAIAVSVGVQDVLGVGGSAGYRLPSDAYSSRSVFAVATGRIDVRGGPYFLSAGGGDHRFDKGFGSVSRQVAPSVRTWLEYDGWGFNEGALVSRRMRAGHVGLTLSGDIGLVRGRYLTISGGLGF